ncbi:MAG: metal-dependent hydrolase [Thermoplasmata archaeon]|nr:MAG: metal-dependent hydrolase [Thermoplasmata archaeon]
MSILIKDSIIVTQNVSNEIVRGDIYIEDNKIVEIGKINVEADFVIRNRIVNPGLINMHTHLPMTLLRGYGDDLPLEEWLTTRIWPIEAKLKAEHIAIGTKLAFMEMVRSGTTCCNDMYFFEDVIANEAKKFGIRCYAGFSLIDFDTPEMKRECLPSECENFIKKWKNDELVEPVVAPHSTYACSPETLQKAKEIAEKYNCFIHIHCSETRYEVYDVLNKYGKRPLQQIKDNGLLTEKTMLAHCGWITKEEVKEIALANACVIHNPVSNMKLATGGYTPLPELMEANAIITLGTDGAASNNKLDMFETMKFTALIHKHHRWDASIVKAQEVLDMATVNPAGFLELNAGCIEEGKLADIVCIDYKAPNLTPLHNVISHLVYAMDAHNVSDVIINGKLILHERKFLNIDEEKVYEEAEKAKEDLLSE